MISSSWENFWLLVSSSQAAVTDTTSGLMLFSCSSNWSLNKMASSLTFSCFTVDIWQERKGQDAGMRRFLTIDTSVLWEYWRGWFYLLRILRCWTKLLVFGSVAQGFSVSNKYLLRPRPLQFQCVLFLVFLSHWFFLLCLWLVTFKSADSWRLHFTHHHSKLLRLSHVLIFVLHLTQCIQLAFFRQLF